jgi:hypothetical protein
MRGWPGRSAPARAGSIGLFSAYFGVAMVRLAAETMTGIWQRAGSDPLWSYLGCRARVPGLGLGASATGLAYRRATSSPCRTCRR